MSLSQSEIEARLEKYEQTRSEELQGQLNRATGERFHGKVGLAAFGVATVTARFDLGDGRTLMYDGKGVGGAGGGDFNGDIVLEGGVSVDDLINKAYNCSFEFGALVGGGAHAQWYTTDPQNPVAHFHGSGFGAGGGGGVVGGKFKV